MLEEGPKAFIEFGGKSGDSRAFIVVEGVNSSLKLLQGKRGIQGLPLKRGDGGRDV